MKHSGTAPVLLPTALLLLMFTLMTGSALHKKFAYDEEPHLSYGFRFLTEGPLSLPDGQRMPVSGLNALPCISYRCDSALLAKNEIGRLTVRLPTMFLALLLGLMIYRWTYELYGKGAALLSLCLYTFNPNYLAHGKQVTSDLATSLFFLLSVYFFWRLMTERKTKDFYFCAVSTAATLVSKYSGFLLFLVLPSLWILKKWVERRQKQKGSLSQASKGLAKVFLFCALVWLLVNSTYLFQGSFEKASGYPWKSHAYQRLKSFNIPVPFPRVFALGMDYTSYVQENPQIGRGNNYILGKRHRKGRWYAFPLMILLKTPLPFFALLILALFSRPPSSVQRPQDTSLYLLFPFAVWLFAFSVFCHAQLGVRYVLPAFSFLVVYAGRAATSVRTPKGTAGLAFLLAWYVFSSLSYHPHYMSYFNELIGPRINAYKFLADSNLDWEDKSYFLEQFKKKHPELDIDLGEPLRPKAGFLIVGANEYVGVLDEARSDWLREFEPLTHITYSHYLFYVSPDRLKEVLAKTGRVHD